MATEPSPAAKKAAEMITGGLGMTGGMTNNDLATIIDRALVEERKAADAILAWLETQPENDPDDQTGYYAIAAYRRARGQA